MKNLADTRKGFIISLGAATLAACGGKALTPLLGSGGRAPDNACAPGYCGGGGGGGAPSGWSTSYTTYAGSTKVTCYAYPSNNVVGTWDSAGNHITTYSNPSANSDGSVNYTISGNSGNTVSGTHPAVTSIPLNANYGYKGSTIYANTSAQTVAVNLLNTGTVYTMSVKSGNIVASSPGKSSIVIPLSSIGAATPHVAGRHVDIQVNCVELMMLCMAEAAAAAAAAAAIVIAGCAGDGPAAIVTCWGAQAVANAILTYASTTIQQQMTAHGC